MKEDRAEAHELAATRWAARPRLAFVLRVVAALLPFACSVAVTRFVQQGLHVPSGIVELLGTWAMLAVVGTSTLVVVERFSRRLLPLAALLRMSLVFPDAAPSRFRSAIRTGTVAQLERRIENVQERGIGNTPAEAARTLIDLLAALNRHDRLTRGHAERVRAYARLIGEELGFDEEKLDLLHWAALVHDIGKLIVPAEILQKPGRLTDEEYAIVREHPAAGAAMVEPLADWLGEWRLAVLEHHERWDGAGYPRGLAGEEISLAGRIVAVADVFDVITSPRSYKPAISADEARQEIARCSGTHFDPTVVRAFLNIGIGRLRLLLGPVAWLSQVRVLGELPLAPIGAAATGAAASVAAVVAPVLSEGPDASVAAAEARAEPDAAMVAWGATPTTAYEPPTTTTIVVTTTAPPRAAAPAASEPESEVLPEPEPEPGAVPSEPDVAPPAPVEEAPDPKEVVPLPPTTVPRPVPTPTTAPRPTPTTAPPTTTTLPPPANAHPNAVDDVLTVTVGTSGTVDVLANDTDPDGDGLVLLSLDTSGVDNGTVSFTPDGTLTYTATAPGTDTVGYEVRDGFGGRDVAVVTITVPMGSPPVLAIDQIGVVGGGAFVLPAPGVLANDGDPDGDALTVTGVAPQNANAAAAGTLTVAPDGSLEFTPRAGFEGLVKWLYTVEDASGATATQRIEITVSANPFGGVVFLRQGGLLTAAPPPVVDPEPDPPGGDLLPGRTIEKGGADTSADAAELQDEIDDHPRHFGVWSSGPLGTDTTLDGPVTLALFTQFNDPALVGAEVDYAVWLQECNPATNNCETLAHVTDRVSQWNRGLGGWQRTTIPLGDVEHDVLHGWQLRLVVAFDQQDLAVAMTGGRPSRLGFGVTAPVANDDAATGNEDDAELLVDLVANDTDADGEPLSVESITSPTSGTASITPTGVRYVPPAGWSGTTTLDYVVTDSFGLTDTGTLTIDVLPVDDPPTLVAGPAVTVAEDSGAATFPGWATGISGGPPDEPQAVTISVTTDDPGLFAVDPAVDPATGDLTFTPAANSDGTAALTITIGDGAVQASVPSTITVTPAADDPSANDDAYASDGSPIAIAAPGLLGNDGDHDGDTVTVVGVNPPTSPAGTLAVQPDGSLTFTPDPLFTGDASWTYTVSDGTGRTATAALTIMVSPTSTTTALHLAPGGGFSAAPLAVAASEPDDPADADSDPGLTIEKGDKTLLGVLLGDAEERGTWTTAALGAPMVLDGPAELELWSAIEGLDVDDKHVHVSMWVEDCNAALSSCTTVAAIEDLHVDPWNGGPAGWRASTYSLGNIDHTVAAGRRLRLVLSFGHEDMWIAMSGSRPSALTFTTA